MEEFIQFHKPYISDDEINEVVDTVRSGWLSMGPKVLKFEEEFRDIIGCKEVVSVNSWTAAGHLTLEAYGLKEGDEVIVPTMTFPATAEIVCYFKAIPVIVDVDEDSLNISIEEIEKAITPKTKAIIPVHYAGEPCDMDEINALAKKYNLKVIEDAAHALPAKYKGRKIGTISDVTCFSFYATKTLATGEGGMICTADEDLAERTRLMRMHGMNKDAWKRYSDACSWYYEVVAPGFKYNFTDIQASLGLAQLRKLDQMREMRANLAEIYTANFKDSKFLRIPQTKPDRETAWHLYAIRLNLEALTIDRGQFINELKNAGVGTGVHFMPVHQHIYYKNTFNLDPSKYPVAEDAFPRLISLPLYPGMTEAQVNKVIDVVNGTAKKFEK
ncbi:MAG: DegT/DnrJ/EryC1/StrS family aminotransferase [Ignavibacteriaceae bacterium]